MDFQPSHRKVYMDSPLHPEGSRELESCTWVPKGTDDNQQLGTGTGAVEWEVSREVAQDDGGPRLKPKVKDWQPSLREQLHDRHESKGCKAKKPTINNRGIDKVEESNW